MSTLLAVILCALVQTDRWHDTSPGTYSDSTDALPARLLVPTHLFQPSQNPYSLCLSCIGTESKLSAQNMLETHKIEKLWWGHPHPAAAALLKTRPPRFSNLTPYIPAHQVAAEYSAKSKPGTTTMINPTLHASSAPQPSQLDLSNLIIPW